MIHIKTTVHYEEVLTAANRSWHSAIKKTFQEWDSKLIKSIKLIPFNLYNMIELLNFSPRCDAVNEKGLIT